MTDNHNDIRVLASADWTRRNFLRLAAFAGGVAALSINGVAIAADKGDLAEKARSLKGDADLGDTLFIYSWADYANPEVLDAFSKGAGPRIEIATFDSVEAAIAKLEISGGSAGYDIVVVGDAYVEQMINRKLIQKLDHSKLPNLGNLRDEFQNLPFDPGNQYTVMKNFGTIGILYNNTVIKEPIKSWDDFFRVGASEVASRRLSVLNDQPSVFGLVFWREGKDYNTGDEKRLNEAKDVLMRDLIPHLKAFDANPVQGLLNGDYVLSQGYLGSSRHIFEQDPDSYTWVYPEPQCVLWSDHYAVPSGSKSTDAAHAFINYMLDPDVAAAEVAHIGYDTGVKGVIEKLPDDLVRKDMIVFPEGVNDRLIYQKVEGSNPTLRIQIFNELKAVAARN
ncbi:ABC transporter substrate-binding protein [Rhizobium sp. GN54]|uniref:ABC transporter substrate-binding protein n=1 Tax=Rhizobium sp. GN54 TaxID=2898150 RepID=UPI001E5C2CA4|nr:spermidine/putrescine ABC transporter substrate-binding protein [Rhizobium sp. GN54]MCD2184763.1 spermidine/putrescine ABC transporter substrate-binding protein [Rhizobium sp. GN54]